MPRLIMIRPILSTILLPMLVVACIMVPALPAAAQTATRAVQEDVVVAEAADASRIIEVAHLETGHGIVLDGRLDEEVWQQIPPITDFLQQEPQEGARPSERTEVRVAHDGSALYIAVIAFDSDPDGILAYQRRRNAGLGTDDRFMWIIDTFGDGRTAYDFEINPAGVMGDALLRTGQGGGVNKSWDGIWEVRTARGDYGWSAEIRIPFRTLNFNPDRAGSGRLRGGRRARGAGGVNGGRLPRLPGGDGRSGEGAEGGVSGARTSRMAAPQGGGVLLRARWPRRVLRLYRNSPQRIP